jgi:hypothetical protein
MAIATYTGHTVVASWISCIWRISSCTCHIEPSHPQSVKSHQLTYVPVHKTHCILKASVRCILHLLHTVHCLLDQIHAALEAFADHIQSIASCARYTKAITSYTITCYPFCHSHKSQLSFASCIQVTCSSLHPSPVAGSPSNSTQDSYSSLHPAFTCSPFHLLTATCNPVHPPTLTDHHCILHQLLHPTVHQLHVDQLCAELVK